MGHTINDKSQGNKAETIPREGTLGIKKGQNSSTAWRNRNWRDSRVRLRVYTALLTMSSSRFRSLPTGQASLGEEIHCAKFHSLDCYGQCHF